MDPSLPRASRRLALRLAAAAAAAWLPRAGAQGRTLRFALDGRLDGPAAVFALPALKGYFRQEGLDVVLEPGHGAMGVISRLVAGSHEMGCTDLAALMEYLANNPGGANRPVAVMIVHSNTPASVLALARSGIRTPADLAGRRLGASPADTGRRAWPIFARVNAIGGVAWAAGEVAQVEAMLVRGEIDALAGPAYGVLPDLEARGTRPDQLVLLPYAHYGVKLYGAAILAGEDFVKRNPEAVRAALRAFMRGTREVVADPRAAIALMKARDPSLDAARELRRLQLALDLAMLTDDARTEGFGAVTGPRLALMASQVSDAYGTRERVNANAVWNGSFLPVVAERNVFTVARHG